MITASLSITDQPAWQHVDHAADVTETMAEDALDAMELTRAHNIVAHRAGATRIAEQAPRWGRPDLALRARLILADIAARSSPSPEAVEAIEDLLTEAAQHAEALHPAPVAHADAPAATSSVTQSAAPPATGAAAPHDTTSGAHYVMARGHFVLANAQLALDDVSAARIHAGQAVDLLPAHAPVGIRIDHLIVLAGSYGQRPESAEHYRSALELATGAGDVHRAIAVRNELAYTAWKDGEIQSAHAQVAAILELTRDHDITLNAAVRDTVACLYIASSRYREAADLLEPVAAGRAAELGIDTVSRDHTELAAVVESTVTLAQARRMLGEYDAARELLAGADHRFAGGAPTALRARLVQERAYLFAACGDFEQAYREHVRYHRALGALYAHLQQARARRRRASLQADDERTNTERFRALAVRDALTGLYNRRFVDERLATLTEQAERAGTPLSAAIVDADHFKRINDERSHETGDEVLQALAHILSAAVVAPETVGRMGGEEFVILIPSATAAQAFARCEEIRQAIAENDWRPLVGDIPVTVSIGVTTAADGQTSAAALLSDADRNLYVAKRSGRNRVMTDAH